MSGNDRYEEVTDECLTRFKESVDINLSELEDKALRDALHRAYAMGHADGWNACGWKYVVPKQQNDNLIPRK